MYQGNYNVIDIKISYYKDKYTLSSLFKKRKIHISGYKIINKFNQIIEKRRGYLFKATEKEFVEILDRFFGKSNNEHKQKHLKDLIKFLINLYIVCKEKHIVFP